MVITLLSFFISCAMVAFMLPHILYLSLRKRLIDPIDPRKIHTVAASRLGGITFFPSILFSVWFCISITNVFIPVVGPTIDLNIKLILESLALLSLFLIGIYDDILGVPYRSKFLVQTFASLLIISTGTYFKTLHGFWGIDEIPIYLGVPMTLLFYVFVTNAINLIDGIDGLASLLSIMALAAYGVLLYLHGLDTDCIVVIATLGALFPFCYGNVLGIKKGISSKIFMGDTGALVIGAILGFSAVTIWNISFDSESLKPINNIYYILAYTMLLVPCFDVIRIIIHRYLNKKPLFLPDKNHIHHKFMALGFSPRKALLCIITMNIIFVILNVALSYVINFTYIVVIDVIVWTVIHIAMTKFTKGRV